MHIKPFMTFYNDDTRATTDLDEQNPSNKMTYILTSEGSEHKL